MAQTLEEVVVTATKRQESVMDVPLAITALSGNFIADTNLDDVKDLISYTPGVSGNSQDSYIDAVSVRGVRTQDFGVGGDPSSAFFKNDLYEGRNGAVVTSLYDVERAEILRGPQGFLFGRNSIGGAFSVHTNKAEIGSRDGHIDIDLGERDRASFEGAINVPMGDSFAMRFAGYYSQEDGFAKNVFSGKDEIEHEKWALRWSTAFESDRLSVDTVVEYEERRQSGSMYRAITKGDIWDTFDAYIVDDTSLGGSNEELDSDISQGERDNADILTLGLFIDYDLGFATLTSNTGFKDHDYYYKEDYDGTPLSINNFQFQQSGEYFQQELRLTSNGDGPLSWYTGVSYYDEKLDAEFTNIGSEDLMCQYYLNSYAEYYGYEFYTGCSDYYYDFYPTADGMLTESGKIKGKYTGWAAYANLGFDLTDRINVELGVRYTEDKKDFSTWVLEPDSYLGSYFIYGFATDGYISDSKKWDDTTFRGLVTYAPTENSMIFASYTQGFKSGGFGSFWVEDSNGAVPAYETISRSDGYLPGTFEPETADSYEIGFKAEYLDGRGNFDITFFMYDYEDMQVINYVNVDYDDDGVPDAFSGRVLNVGQTDGQGVEISTTVALGENWTLYLAGGYLDTEATGLQDICGLEDPNGCEGSSLFWAPEVTAAGKLDAHFPVANGAITGSFEFFYEDERGGSWEANPEGYIDAYTIANLRVGFESDNNWYVQAYAENVFDEFTWDGYNANGGILPSHFFGPMRPLTIGVRAGMSWD
jgi:iron complex outermembrane receptor protein